MNRNLDLLRAVAVLCVFSSHLFDQVTRTHVGFSFHVGQLGVIMFFVHTSLVLMQSLDRSSLTGAAFYRDFYVHRIFRIYPLSILCVTIAFFIPGALWTLTELFSNLALVQNLTYKQSIVFGLWSLPLEVQMYVMLPFLFLIFRSRPVKALLGFWFLSVGIAAIQPMISGRLGILAYIPCFLGGVLAWRIQQKEVLPAWLFPLALIVSAVPWMASDGNNMYPRWVSCLALGFAIPWFREISSPWVNSVTKIIAKYSYGIYLTHYPAMIVAFRTMQHEAPALQWVVFISLAIIFPVLAYHLVEHPMIKLGKRITNGMTPITSSQKAIKFVG